MEQCMFEQVPTGWRLGDKSGKRFKQEKLLGEGGREKVRLF
jgi:hypothetical protein